MKALKKRVIAAIMILMFLVASPSGAWLWFIIPVTFNEALIASFLAHAGVIAYLMRDRVGGSHKVNPNNGSVGRSVQVVWFDLKDDGTEGSKGANISGKVDFAALQAADKAKYPDLYAATHNIGVTPIDCATLGTVNPQYENGKYYSCGGIIRKTSIGSWINECNQSSSKTYWTQPASPVWPEYIVEHVDAPGAFTCDSGFKPQKRRAINFVTGTPPPDTNKTVAEAVQKLDTAPSDPTNNNVPDVYKDDIDQYIKDNPNVVTFYDSEDPDNVNAPQLSNPPFSQSDIESMQAKKRAHDNYTVYGDTYNTYNQWSTTAQNNATASRDAADNAWDQYNADPTNDALKRAAEEAEAKARAAEQEAARAQAEAEKAKAEMTAAKNQAADAARDENLTAPAVPGDNSYESVIEAPEKKGIAGLLTSTVASSPLASMIRTLGASTSGATNRVSAGVIYGQELAFDFSRWEPALQTLGAVLLAITHAYALMIVFRRSS